MRHPRCNAESGDSPHGGSLHLAIRLPGAPWHGKGVASGALRVGGKLLLPRPAPGHCPPPARLSVPPKFLVWLAFVGILPWCHGIPSKKIPAWLERVVALASSLRRKHFALFASPHFLFIYLFIYLFICLFRAAPSAYGSSQARGLIGDKAAGLCHSTGNARSEPSL